MTDDEIYEAYCVGCMMEKDCHDSCTECDFVTAIKNGVCPVCGKGEIKGGKCTICGVSVDADD